MNAKSICYVKPISLMTWVLKSHTSDETLLYVCNELWHIFWLTQIESTNIVMSFKMISLLLIVSYTLQGKGLAFVGSQINNLNDKYPTKVCILIQNIQTFMNLLLLKSDSFVLRLCPSVGRVVVLPPIQYIYRVYQYFRIPSIFQEKFIWAQTLPSIQQNRVLCR